MTTMRLIESKRFSNYKHYITMISKGFGNAVICKSRAGLGKTQTTLQILEDLNAKFVFNNTYSTPLALYKYMFHNNGKIIVLDDMEMILENAKSVSILKSALSKTGDKRQVSYNTTSASLEGIPQQFTFTGTIIMLLNEIKVKNSRSFDALISRSHNVELTYSFEQTREFACEIVKNKVADPIIQANVIAIINNDIKPYHDFNFRMLDHLIQCIEYNREIGKELFFDGVKVDEDYKIMWELMTQTELTSVEQANQFQTQTGKSRATFFRLKKQLKEEYGI